MVVWSSLSRMLITSPQKNNVALALKRYMSGGPKKMTIEASRWQWHKFKDMLHYYTLVGLIPCLLVAGYCNVFIGPAKLAEIPEGYVPKEWEYYRHPITRFFVRYIQTGYQQEYEKYMHYMYEQDEKAKLRLLTWAVQDKMKERHDYQAWYYQPVTAKYFRQTRDITQRTEQIMGENNRE